MMFSFYLVSFMLLPYINLCPTRKTFSSLGLAVYLVMVADLGGLSTQSFANL